MSSGTQPGRVERAVDAVDVLDVEEDAPRPAEQVAELLDRRAHRGRVDDRQHLVHVLTDEAVEEHLVVVVQLGEEDPLLDVGVLGLELLVAPGRLLVHRLDRRRQQPVQAEMIALLQRERRSAVDLGVVEHGKPPGVDLDVTGPVCTAAEGEIGRRHGDASSRLQVGRDKQPDHTHR